MKAGFSFLVISCWTPLLVAFCADNNSAAFTLFERFRATCPADVQCIRQFDASLVSDDSSYKREIWVAVHRSSNNMPSVLLKDDFLHAMRSATGALNFADTTTVEKNLETTASYPLQRSAPVAVARLRTSDTDLDNASVWVMDSIRCILKKETMNEACDGGSEHNEAISIAIDALILHHLAAAGENARFFQGAIRCKATLFSGNLLLDRGFDAVEHLQKDMASHVSSLDTCLSKYAERLILAKTPGSRQRALEIVSLLGRLDRTRDMENAQQLSGEDDETRDPWEGMKRFIY
jgi:hypothetical protein